jgi:hypothetical protein
MLLRHSVKTILNQYSIATERKNKSINILLRQNVKTIPNQ